MSTALDNTGHNCNLAIEAESLIMAKERLIENYGDVRYTIGTGCSGGSIVQQTVANAYPGAVYDGLVITCAYPDMMSAGAQFADYHLLRLYFENPSHWGTGVFWPPVQWGPVEGRPDPVNAITADEGLFKGATNPVGGCVPGRSGATTRRRNPGGVRCSILDYMINLLGPRPQSVWSDMERRAGHGFAGQPFGNAGIQYGLGALAAAPDHARAVRRPQRGDRRRRHRSQPDAGAHQRRRRRRRQRLPQRPRSTRWSTCAAWRSSTTPAPTRAPRTTTPTPGGSATASTARRATTANHVLWFGPAPLIGSPTWPTEALLAMDRWLPRSSATTRASPARARSPTIGPPTSRTAARRRHLQAVVRDALRDAAQRRRRRRAQRHRQVPPQAAAPRGLPGRRSPMPSGRSCSKAFPDGVCDWSKPGTGQGHNVAWLTYQDAKGDVIYGGRPMGPPPRSRPLRAR